MESGYRVAEVQHPAVDERCSTVFSIPHEMNINQSGSNGQQQNPNQYYQKQSYEQQQQPGAFQNLIRIPITQQFFEQQHQFQGFQQQRVQQQGLEQVSVRVRANDNSAGNLFPFVPVDFKLDLNQNSVYREDAVLPSQQHNMPQMSQLWLRQQDSAIVREPFWKTPDMGRLSVINKVGCKEGEKNLHGSSSREQVNQNCNQSDNYNDKYGFFGELEAIYSRSAGCEINQTASGSALTCENTPTTAGCSEPFGGYRRVDGTSVAAAAAGVDHGSETSIGEEVSLRKLHKRRRSKKHKQLSSITCFFEKLVKQLMDHQEGLHKRFLEVMERRDQERREREEAWRRQLTEKYSRDAEARAEEHAQASNREVAIVSCLEKMTGRTDRPLLPNRRARTEFETQIPEEDSEQPTMLLETNNTSSRWPEAEVQALIRVRSSLESKFQEPGLKGPLWEAISSSMAAVGYQRSAKRCKEKWENINKYFRKTKDGAKKRPRHSKSCPYFHQLNQFYSSGSYSSSSSFDRPKDSSELLDAVIVGSTTIDIGNAQNDSHGFVHQQLKAFKMNEMGTLKLESHGSIDVGREEYDFLEGEPERNVGKEICQEKEGEDDDNAEKNPGQEDEEDDENGNES